MHINYKEMFHCNRWQHLVNLEIEQGRIFEIIFQFQMKVGIRRFGSIVLVLEIWMVSTIKS